MKCGEYRIFSQKLHFSTIILNSILIEVSGNESILNINFSHKFVNHFGQDLLMDPPLFLILLFHLPFIIFPLFLFKVHGPNLTRFICLFIYAFVLEKK